MPGPDIPMGVGDILTDMGVSENGGTQQPWVFPLKMTILRCFGGTTIYGSTLKSYTMYLLCFFGI